MYYMYRTRIRQEHTKLYDLREDQPVWYHTNWIFKTPHEMTDTELMTYLMENPYRNLPRLPPNSQAGGFNLLDFFKVK